MTRPKAKGVKLNMKLICKLLKQWAKEDKRALGGA
jgi:hypothetical protein